MTLTQLFTNIANAIRGKKGTSELIKAEDFADEITNLPSGGNFVVPNGLKFGYSSIEKFPKEFEEADYSQLDNTGLVNFFYNSSFDEIKFKIPKNCSQLSGMFYQSYLHICELDFDEETTFNISNMFYDVRNYSTGGGKKFENLIFTNNKKMKITDARYAFYRCGHLKTAPEFIISEQLGNNGFNGMFERCLGLENVPFYDFSNVPAQQLNRFGNLFSAMYNYCNSLTDTSLDNILRMCISISPEWNGFSNNFATLATLGISSTYDTRISSLPHYQEFINAGWIIR